MVPVSALYYLPLPQEFNIFIIHIFNKKILSVDQSKKHDFKSQKSLFNTLFSSPGLSLFVRPSTFHILIFSSETTGPIATKLWWNGPWMAPFQNCVR
jgi:hypothetical protein